MGDASGSDNPIKVKVTSNLNITAKFVLMPVMVKDICPINEGSSLSEMTNINGTLFFVTSDEAYGTELWKSDGTEDGTVMVKDINPEEGDGSFPSKLTNVGGKLFFVASDETNSSELWISDGTENGTTIIKDIGPGGNSSSPSYLTNVGGTLFFVADNWTHGSELWKSDGTTAGTVMVKDILPYSWYSGSPGYGYPSYTYCPHNLTDVDGMLFFAAYDENYNVELWKMMVLKLVRSWLKIYCQGSMEALQAT